MKFMFQKLKLKLSAIQATDTRIISLISIIFIAIFIVSSTVYYIFAIQPAYISTSGSIISSPSTLGVTPSTISWGQIQPGDSVSRIVRLDNSGSLPISLQFATTGWLNSTDIGLRLAWDYQGGSLAAGASVYVTFTLTAAATASPNDFSFNIVIIA